MTEAAGTWPADAPVGTDAQVEGPKKRGRKPLPEGQRAANRRAYWEQWYEQHKEEIAAKRARAWREDPEYRDRENARRRRQRKAQRAKAPKVPRPRAQPWQVYQVEVCGVRQPAYTLGYVAHRLGCSEALLRLWRWRDQMPSSPLKSGAKHLYTEAMVEALVGARDRRARPRAGGWSVGSDPTMGEELREAWERITQKKVLTGHLAAL